MAVVLKYQFNTAHYKWYNHWTCCTCQRNGWSSAAQRTLQGEEAVYVSPTLDSLWMLPLVWSNNMGSTLFGSQVLQQCLSLQVATNKTQAVLMNLEVHWSTVSRWAGDACPMYVVKYWALGWSTPEVEWRAVCVCDLRKLRQLTSVTFVVT